MKRIFKSDKKEEEELSLRYDILDIKDKINECQTSDIGDEYVSLIFKETKKNILYSVVCKDTDKFIIAFNELKRKYRDLNENEYECKCGGITLAEAFDSLSAGPGTCIILSLHCGCSNLQNPEKGFTGRCSEENADSTEGQRILYHESGRYLRQRNPQRG